MARDLVTGILDEPLDSNQSRRPPIRRTVAADIKFNCSAVEFNGRLGRLSRRYDAHRLMTTSEFCA